MNKLVNIYNKWQAQAQEASKFQTSLKFYITGELPTFYIQTIKDLYDWSSYYSRGHT